VSRFPFLFAAFVLVGCGSEGNPDEAADSPVRLNEFMPSNSNAPTASYVPAHDELGEYDDWIEIYNKTDAAVSLEGYYVSDKAAEPTRYALPSGVEVPANGYLLLWADDTPAQGRTHLPFKLKAAAEGVYLSSPNGNRVDGQSFTTAPQNRSMARHPDGEGEFGWCATPTPLATNGPSCGSSGDAGVGTGGSPGGGTGGSPAVDAGGGSAGSPAGGAGGTP
jgi:hypothetical protein